jgi:hypothetical protein
LQIYPNKEDVDMKTKLLLIVFIVITILGASREAEVSVVVRAPVSLEDVIRWSDLVLVVSKEDPDESVENVPIDDKGVHPPYKRRNFHFRVIEELHDKTGLNVQGTSIAVLAANDDAQLMMHRMYYEEGRSRSPIFSSYDSGVDLMERSGEFIVFLKENEEDRLLFTVIGSYEAMSNKDEVINLIVRQDRTNLKTGNSNRASKSLAAEDGLIAAALAGDLDRVNTLLAAGTDVNARDEDGWTALLLASRDGHQKVARALLAAKADVNAAAEDGATALIAASQNGHWRWRRRFLLPRPV